MVDTSANETLTIDDGGKVPGIAGQAVVGGVEVQEIASRIAGHLFGVELDDLRAQPSGGQTNRAPHEAADSVGTDEGRRTESSGGALYHHTVAFDRQAGNLGPFANPHATIARDASELVIDRAAERPCRSLPPARKPYRSGA